jgi:sec-independent protein translocase protein TatC
MKLFGLRSLATVARQVARVPVGPHGDGASHDVAAPGEAGMLEMSFLDHLEELRWRIWKGLGGLLVMTVACSFFADWIIQTLLLGPTHKEFFMYRVFGIASIDVVLQNRNPTGQFFAYWGTIFSVGLILGSPVIVWQLWKFIEPGLYPNEKTGLRFSAVFATFFFVLGITFGYLVLTPLALQFFANFSISDQIVNEFDISKYFGMVVMWCFGVGMLFELPVVIYFLAKMGVVTEALLRSGRRYAIIINLVIAALLTPPDPISQVIVAIPLLGLYELSIHICAFVERRREKELKAALE